MTPAPSPAPSNSSKAKAGASAPVSLLEHNQRLAKENRRLKEKLAHQAAFLRGRGFNPDALVTEADLANFSKWGEGFMKEAAKAERSAPKFGGQLTAAYDWLADNHHNPGLRRALGCKPSAFRLLCRDAGIPASETDGKSGRFTFNQVVDLLRVRLTQRQRPGLEARVTIACDIWQRIRSQRGPKRNAIRSVLRETGAACAEEPVKPAFVPGRPASAIHRGVSGSF